MATSKVALGLSRLSVSQKAALVSTIEVQMTDNPHFPKPSPELSTVTGSCKAMTDQVAKRDLLRQQAKQATTDLTVLENALDQKLTALAAYVDNVAQGNAAIIESAGMTAAEATSGRSAVKLPAPDGLAASQGDEPGEVDVHWNSVKGARAYTVRYGQDGPDALGHQIIVTRSKTDIAGLKSGQAVWLQVVAVGPEGGSPSQPVRCMVP